MRSIWVLRGVLIALTAALAIALILRGHVVIGALLGALAVTRAMLFLSMRHRRVRLRRRLAQRRVGRW